MVPDKKYWQWMQSSENIRPPINTQVIVKNVFGNVEEQRFSADQLSKHDWHLTFPWFLGENLALLTENLEMTIELETLRPSHDYYKSRSEDLEHRLGAVQHEGNKAQTELFFANLRIKELEAELKKYKGK